MSIAAAQSSEAKAAAPRMSAALPSGGGIGLRGLVLAVVVAALAIGSATMALASLAAFQRTLMQTVDSRLSEIATEIARAVENGLQAGVALQQQRRLLAVMADERAQAPDISAIRLIDDRGHILFATNEAEIGEQAASTDLPPGLPAAVAAGQAATPWHWVGEHRIVFGQPLVGLFGEQLGSVTVELPRDALAAQSERFALSLALVAAAITACGGLLAAFLLAVIPLPAARRLDNLQRRLETLYEAAGRHDRDAMQPQRQTSPAEIPPGALPGVLVTPLSRFEAWLDQRLGRLAEHEAEVRRLDETA